VSTTVSVAHEREAGEAIRLHRLMTGFLASRALFSAVELGVFDALERGECTAEELGARVGLADRPARVLLLAMEGEDLVRSDRGRYRNSPVASRHLVSASPDYIGPLGTHQAAHFDKLTHLTQALRDNEPIRAGSTYSGAFVDARAWARKWAETTRASSRLMAEDLAASAPLAGRRHLVDLGCASGAYAMALARANPALRVTAVEQPAIADVAREYVAEAGLGHRVEVRPGDIFADTFPECDVALLSHVIQGFERDRARQLIEHVYGWLPDGAELLLHSHLPERATVPFPYLFGLILLVNNTQGGEAHGEELTCEWLAGAGFRDVRVVEVSPISALFRATKRAG
jgi:cyclopropane fatty-acyl-phospholipid synthase-like methyltransferase